jgi:hypothetical protein
MSCQRAAPLECHKRCQRTHVLLGELPLEGHHPQSVSGRAQDALGIRLQFIQIRPHLAAGCRCLEGMAQGTGGLDGGKQRLATRQHLRICPLCGTCQPQQQGPQRTSAASPPEHRHPHATVTVTE